MKLLTGSALAVTLALAAAFPALAGDTVPSGEIKGEVESINGSTLMIRNQDGSSSSFSIAPDLASSLNLEQGRSVMINGTKLKRGVITGVDDNTVKVRHDNGDVETYILHRESRRYLSYGDRVVVNARGMVVHEERFQLTASEITPVYDYIVASQSTTQIASSAPIPEPEVEPTYEPVPGLW